MAPDANAGTPRRLLRDDRRWMAQALALAARGEGRTSPNPMVGCVVVREGEAVGLGFHRATGRRHAEAVALDEAGELARDATLYVNLEPCAHHGRTPPCTERVIASGVRRVVAAIQDPDPRVDGKGFDAVRDAGIEVVVGVLAEEARGLNAAFLHWHRSGRPLVTLKAALSADGQLAAAGGASRWITGEPARRFAHRLRATHDAVLVGAGTVRVDDPSLDVRLPGAAVRRPRIVLSGSLELPPEPRLLRGDGPLWIYTTEEALARRGAAWRARGARVAAVPAGPHGPDLVAVLEDLGGRGVQSVLVEGGGRVHASLLAAGAASRAALFRSGKLFGGRGATPLIDAAAVRGPDAGWFFRVRRTVPLGRDRLDWGELIPPGEA